VDTVDRFSTEAPDRQARTRVWPILLIAVIAWWVVGSLPWIVGGLGSGSPRDWAADPTTGEAGHGYITLLPFRASTLPALLAVTVVGGAVAGLSTRWLRRDAGRRFLGGVCAAAGALAATSYTVAQSAGATRQLGSDFDSDDRVLLGVVVVAVVGSVVGLVLGLCLATGRPVLGALAAAPLAAAAGDWLAQLTIALLGAQEALPLLRWTPVVVGALVGLALARAGLRPVRRVVTWVVVLGGLVVLQAAQTAFVNLVAQLRPGTGLPAGLREQLASAREVFLLALRPEHQILTGYAVAVAVGLVGTAVLWGRGPSGTTPDGGPTPAAPDAAPERVPAQSGAR
jgi:hypothetical protein